VAVIETQIMIEARNSELAYLVPYIKIDMILDYLPDRMLGQQVSFYWEGLQPIAIDREACTN
jgi:hypothetical protein